MPDLGLDALWRGKNFARLLAGLWVSVRISLISVVICLPLGVLFGSFMTWKNPIARGISRIYLEIVRIMPRWCFYSLFFFGSTRMFQINLSAELSAVLVFSFWGTAEITMVVITHEMRVVREICDRVAVLEKGHLVETGTVDEVFANPKTGAAKQLILTGMGYGEVTE